MNEKTYKGPVISLFYNMHELRLKRGTKNGDGVLNLHGETGEGPPYFLTSGYRDLK